MFLARPKVHPEPDLKHDLFHVSSLVKPAEIECGNKNCHIQLCPEPQDAIKTESPSRHIQEGSPNKGLENPHLPISLLQSKRLEKTNIQFLDELIDLDAIAGLPRRWKKNT